MPDPRTAGAPASGVVGLLVALAMMVAVAAPAGAATSLTSPTSPTIPPAAGQDSGAIGIRLLDAPVAAGDDPRARIYVVDHLNEGTTIRRRIEVSNTTASSQQLALYAAAATITQGSFLGAAAHTANDLSTWTTVSPGAPVVPAGGAVTATVTIAVPQDAPPGEQYGVVWAEARSAPQPGGRVVQVNRVGIRLYLSVGPGGAPAADFSIESVSAERSSTGQPVVLARVHNTGGRALDMTGALTLSAGPGGLSAGPFPAKLGVTLPIDGTEPVSIALDKQVPAGPWDAHITLRSGLVERTTSATITFPTAGVAAAVTTTSGVSSWIYPLILILLLAVTVLFVVLRRRSEGDRRHPAEPAQARRMGQTG